MCEEFSQSWSPPVHNNWPKHWQSILLCSLSMCCPWNKMQCRFLIVLVYCLYLIRLSLQSLWTAFSLFPTAFGHNFAGERHIPVLLKDVAGLVPGACDGRGRGNRFLNDLLDADVLIHVTDASGLTNENGEAAEGYDPALDIAWLQQELHRWIYDNVMDKWDTICRRPSKLIDMFTGYHTNRATINAVLQKAGVDKCVSWSPMHLNANFLYMYLWGIFSYRMLSTLPQWDEDVLHRIVDVFLQIRFPVLNVLNKCDMPSSAANIQRLDAIIAVWLCWL